MQYILLFLEGMITFISPCLLPLLPLYISFFAGGKSNDEAINQRYVIINAVMFILGFTIIFVLLGVVSSSLGVLLLKYRMQVNMILGLVVGLLGLNYIFSFFNFHFFKGVQNKKMLKQTPVGSFTFGVLFAISWSPCIGVFLGAALIQASQATTALNGAMLLFAFSLGLGIPLFISAIIIDKLRVTFTWIKQNYRFINLISGLFLIIMGILMIFGILDKLVLSLL